MSHSLSIATKGRAVRSAKSTATAGRIYVLESLAQIPDSEPHCIFVKEAATKLFTKTAYDKDYVKVAVVKEYVKTAVVKTYIKTAEQKVFVKTAEQKVFDFPIFPCSS